MSKKSRPRCGFTLVELLVVIGIIALLIAILLPALQKVQEQAKLLQCMSTVRSMSQAMQLHAADHKGYYQIAGCHWDQTQPPGQCIPAGLDDPLSKKYVYYTDANRQRPAPLSVMLSLAMGKKIPINTRAEMETEMKKPEFAKPFRCPTDERKYVGRTQEAGSPEGGWAAPSDPMSYVFNEAALGRREKNKGIKTPQGNTARIRHAAQIILFSDGIPRGRSDHGWLTMPELNANDKDTDLWEYYQATQRDWGNFDHKRHRGRMNVVYFDGHAETVTMPPLDAAGNPKGPGGFNQIGLTKWMYSN
jgi:prepilin-type N-terminal cleavage/methylation domain-containing protein/prepilin-type processing-associated H-X9-DG protein